MNGKSLVAVIVVVILVAAVAIGISASINNNESTYENDVIIYNGNGGSYEGQTTHHSQSAIVFNAGFVNGDYTLTSWNTNPDGSGTDYHARDSVDADPGSPITLYAQWHYVMNLGESTQIPSTQVDYSDILWLIGGSEQGSSLLANGVIIDSSSPIILIYSEQGKWTWTMGSDGQTFIATNSHGDTYALSIKLTSGAVNVEYRIDESTGAPIITFDRTSNVGYDTSVIVHYNRSPSTL